MSYPTDDAIGGPSHGDGGDSGGYRFEESEYEFDPRSVRVRQEGDYDVLEFPGSVPDQEPARLGQPQLPVVIKWFAIPRDTRVASVDVEAEGWEELDGQFALPPIGWEEDEDQERDPEYYESDRPFPPIQGFASRTMEYRGYYLAQVVIYPIRWNPETGSADLARAMTVSVRTQALTGEDARAVPRVRRPEGADPYGETRRFLVGQVENRAQMESLYPWTARGTRVEQEHRATESTPYGGTPGLCPSEGSECFPIEE